MCPPYITQLFATGNKDVLTGATIQCDLMKKSVIVYGTAKLLVASRVEILRHMGLLVDSATTFDSFLSSERFANTDLFVLCSSLSQREQMDALGHIVAGASQARTIILTSLGESEPRPFGATLSVSEGPVAFVDLIGQMTLS